MPCRRLPHAHPLAFFLSFPSPSSFSLFLSLLLCPHLLSARAATSTPLPTQHPIYRHTQKSPRPGVFFQHLIFLDLYTVLARGKLRFSRPLCLAPPQTLRSTDFLRPPLPFTKSLVLAVVGCPALFCPRQRGLPERIGWTNTATRTTKIIVGIASLSVVASFPSPLCSLRISAKSPRAHNR